ncbi:MAG: hypothetical protein ACOX5R_12570 [bacterium]
MLSTRHPGAIPAPESLSAGHGRRQFNDAVAARPADGLTHSENQLHANDQIVLIRQTAYHLSLPVFALQRTLHLMVLSH